MAFGDIAKLLASLDLDTRPFEKGAGRVSGDLSKMEGGMGRVSTRAIALGTAVGVGLERLAEKGIGVLFDSIRSGEDSLRNLQDLQAQTGAVIESTGGAAGVSAQQVRDLANSLEDLTTVDDKNVQAGENVLLRYTAIGKDIFPQASKAATDLAVALAKGDAANADVAQSAAQIGKALQDPIKGLTSLRKAGVVFTAQEQDQIKALVKAGDTMGAQQAILRALETRYGKAGEAAGKSASGPIRRLHDAIEDTQISLAQGLAPALDEIRTDLATALSDPKTQDDVRHLGEFLGEAAKSGLEFARSVPWGQIADGLRTAAGFAGQLFKAFANLPPGVQATIIGLAGLNKLSGGGVIKIGVDLFKEGAQGLFRGLFQRGSSPANPLFVTGTGLGGGEVAGAAGGIGTIGKIALVGEAIGLVAAVEGVREQIASSSTQQANDIHQSLTDNLTKNVQTVGSLNSQLAAIDHGINDLQSNPLNVLVQGDALNQLQQMRAEVVAKLAQVTRNTSDSPDARDERARQNAQAIAAKLDKTQAVFAARLDGEKSAVVNQGALTRGAIHDERAAIVTALRQNRPIVNVSVSGVGDRLRVTKNYTSGAHLGHTGGQQEF